MTRARRARLRTARRGATTWHEADDTGLRIQALGIRRGGLGDLQGQHRHAWAQDDAGPSHRSAGVGDQSEVGVHGVRANSWPRIVTSHCPRSSVAPQCRVLPKHATRARSCSISLSHAPVCGKGHFATAGRALPPQLTAALPCPFFYCLANDHRSYHEKSLRPVKRRFWVLGRNGAENTCNAFSLLDSSESSVVKVARGQPDRGRALPTRPRAVEARPAQVCRSNRRAHRLGEND